MRLSTVSLLILAAVTAAVVSAAFRNVVNQHDHSCDRPAPRGTLVQALLSD